MILVSDFALLVDFNISSVANLAGNRSNATPAHSNGTPALPSTFPATGTSANIATAFARALPQAQPPRTTAQRRANESQQATEEQQEEDSGSGKETQRTGKEGVSKKRKVSPSMLALRVSY